MLFSPSRGTTLTTSVFIATIGLLIFFSLIKHVKRQVSVTLTFLGRRPSRFQLLNEPHLNIEQRKLHQLSKSKGCQSPKHLPNSLLLPFGLDKYRAFAKAEKSNRLPILCLSEHEKHGDTYAQNAGGIYIMFTREPANLRAVLSTQFKDFELGDIRRGILFPLLGSGIFTNDSVQWEKSRKLLAPIFHKPNVPSLDVLELHTQNLIRRITSSKAVYNGDSSRVDIDLQPPILEFNLDTATHIFFGKSTSCLAGTSSGATADFPRPFNYALGYLARRERLRAFYWLLNGSKFRRSCKEAHENLEQIIKDSIQSFDWNGDHSTALQHIQEHIEDDASLRDEILNLLFAARDTSAAFLNWIFYTLAREPEVCRKVREEIQCVLENEAKAPNSEELAQMIYLDDVMNEGISYPLQEPSISKPSSLTNHIQSSASSLLSLLTDVAASGILRYPQVAVPWAQPPSLSLLEHG